MRGRSLGVACAVPWLLCEIFAMTLAAWRQPQYCRGLARLARLVIRVLTSRYCFLLYP